MSKKTTVANDDLESTIIQTKSAEMNSDWEQRIKEQIDEIVEFEKEIANITKSSAERRQDSKTYRNTTLTELNEKADFLNWTEYFNAAFFHHLNKPLAQEYQDVTYAEGFIG